MYNFVFKLHKNSPNVEYLSLVDEHETKFEKHIFEFIKSLGIASDASALIETRYDQRLYVSSGVKEEFKSQMMKHRFIFKEKSECNKRYLEFLKEKEIRVLRPALKQDIGFKSNRASSTSQFYLEPYWYFNIEMEKGEDQEALLPKDSIKIMLSDFYLALESKNSNT